MQSLLNESVLVLNRHWTAVHVTSARRALVLLAADHARVVADDYAVHDFQSWREVSEFLEEAARIATPSFQIAIPEVIILRNFHRFPPRQVKFSRRNIYLRDNYTCQYCGVMPPKDELTIDHVLPRSRGGRSTWDNVVLACIRCNTRKGSHLPHEASMKMLTQPHKPHWLACSQFNFRAQERSMWQRFLDNAYWNLPLKE